MEAAGGGRRSGERQPEEVWRWCKLLKESLQSNSSCSVPHGLLAGTRVGADGCGKWSLSSVAPPPSFNQEKLTVYLLISNKRPCLSSRPQVEVSLLCRCEVRTWCRCFDDWSSSIRSHRRESSSFTRPALIESSSRSCDNSICWASFCMNYG